MRPHSIQSKTIKVKNLNTTNFDSSDLSSPTPGFSQKHSQDFKPMLRRCESASSLMRKNDLKNSHHMNDLEMKYKMLEKKYRKMLEEVRIKSEEFCKQKEEIERLTKTIKREEKEKEMLNEMLRINLKTKTSEEYDQLDEASRQKNSIGSSELTAETRCERPSINTSKISYSQERPTSFKDVNTQVVEKERKKMGEYKSPKGYGKEKTPLVKKYKFIPTLTFKHV